MSQLARMLGGGISRAPQARRAIPPGLAKFLSKLSYEDEAAALDRFFGRVPEPSNDLNDLALSESMPEQFAGADPGLFGGPMVQRMLEEAELRQAVEPASMAPLADMMSEMNRRRALERATLSRLPEGDPRRQLANIAQDAQEGIYLQQAAEAGQMRAAQREAERRARGLGETISSWSPLIAGAVAGGGVAALAPTPEAEPGRAAFGYPLPEDEIVPTEPTDLAAMLSSLPGATAWAGDSSHVDYYSPPVETGEEDMIVREILSGIDDIPMADEPEITLESDPFSDAILAAETSEPQPRYRVRAGAERIPGLSVEEQQVMDALIRRGVEPLQALMMVRGQLPMSTGVR